MSRGCFKEVLRVLPGSLNGVSMQFQIRFKEDSRVLKKVSSLFQENIIKSVKGCFKNLSIKICFAIA